MRQAAAAFIPSLSEHMLILVVKACAGLLEHVLHDWQREQPTQLNCEWLPAPMRVIILLSGGADALVLYHTVLHNVHLSATVCMPFVSRMHFGGFLRAPNYSSAFSLICIARKTSHTANGSIRPTHYMRTVMVKITLFLSVTYVSMRFFQMVQTGNNGSA